MANATPPTAGVRPPHRLTFDKARVQIDVSFWLELRRLKLEEWRLREPTVPICGRSTAVVPLDEQGEAATLPRFNGSDTVLSRASFHAAGSHQARAGVEEGSVDGDSAAHFVRPTVPGQLTDHNTLGELTNLNTGNALFAVLRDSLLVPLLLRSGDFGGGQGDGSAREDAEAEAWRAAPFLSYAMHAYVDAKGYKFHHREAFPVMSVDSPITVTSASSTAVTPEAALAIRRHCAWRVRHYGLSTAWSPFLCVVRGEGGAASLSFEDFSPARLERLRSAAGPAAGGGRTLICFHDAPVGPATEVSIGWHMRNFLLCLRLAVPTLTAFSLYAVRHYGGGEDGGLLVDCTCDPLDAAVLEDLSSGTLQAASPPAWLRVTGWRKTLVHVVNVSSQLDQTVLASEGSRLNLELMKWRQLPDLELSGLARCRALLLGTGTLGCNIARNLLMWGVHHITLVDRGRVSYSNLARQSLFTAADAAGRRREKTVAAADALRAIIPAVRVEPITMTIHMPGHRIDPANADVARGEIERLAALIANHDVVFLLTDSWEARWLPTVLAAASNTPAINVALGFDSYVVMRHGMAGSGVRCYFCSDLTAPTDSLSGRPLDQQCTVTRPGVSSMASALAVELLAAMYQQDPPLGYRPEGGTAPARDDQSSRLGVVPQQIRGDLFTQTVRTVTGERNASCTACSDPILDAYRREGSEFLLRCINDPSLIERVSGLDKTKARYEAQLAEQEDWSVGSFDSDS